MLRSTVHISLLFAGALLVISLTAPAALAKKDQLQSVAIRLLNATKSNSNKCAAGQKKSLGLWRFDGNKLPLSEASLKRIYSEVMSHLTRNNRKCLSIVDDRAIGALLTHLSKSGALDRAGDNVIAALQGKHQGVDLLIHSELYPEGARYLLSMRLVEVKTGRILAQAKPYTIPKKWISLGSSRTQHTLRGALKAIARELSSTSETIEVLQRFGVFYQHTSAQPDVGLFLNDRITSALVNKLSSKMNQKGVRIRRLRGLKITGDAPSKDLGASILTKSDTYRSSKTATLSWRYWVREKHLDVRIRLDLPSGQVRLWQGNVEKSEFSEMQLKPRNFATLQMPLAKAGFSFHLTTDKGPAPTYAAGEFIQLLLRSSINAHVYCYYVDTKGNIMNIVPLMIKGKAHYSKVKAEEIVRIPNESVSLRFRITDATLGEEIITCFASDKDVRGQLPAQLFPKTNQIIPLLNLAGLRKKFSSLRGYSIAESTVTATIVKGR